MTSPPGPAAPPAGPTPPVPGGAAPASPDVLADALRTAIARSARRLRRERSSDDITDAQFSVLAVLDRHGPATPTALAEHEGVRPPSMTRTVAALLEAGLVVRDLDPDDGRRAVVGLAPAGRRHVQDTRRRRGAWLAARLEEMDDEQRAVLARAAVLLQQLAER